MIHCIENGQLSVSIQQKGAEICSLKSKSTQQEYMWDANPDIWASYAPVLFPIIGCLKNGTYTYKGRSYSIPKHGFIRNNEGGIIDKQSATSLTLKYSHNEDTLAMYPFAFIFYITFTLDHNKLIVTHKVVNQGDEEMLFSLGAHPGFRCPFNSGEEYEDYFIEFEHEESDCTWKVSTNGLTNGETKPVLLNTHELPLTKTTFLEDALIFKNLTSRKVSLKNRCNNNSLSLSYSDFNYLGIWAKPGAPFVCIEPWLGITDDESSTGDLVKKEGIIALAAQQTFEASYVIEILEQ